MEKISEILVKVMKKGLSHQANLYLGHYLFKTYIPNDLLSQYEHDRLDFFPSGTLRHTEESLKMISSMFLILRTLISSILLNPKIVFKDRNITKDQSE